MFLSVRKSASYALRKSVYFTNALYEKLPKEIESDFRRVVIFCPYSGVGNLLLWLPALKALRNKMREVEIFLVGPSEDTSLLLTDAGLIQGTFHFAPIADASFFRQVNFIFRHVRELKPDVAVCTFLEPARRASLWALLSGADVRVGYGEKDEGILFTKMLPPRFDIHEVYRNYKLVELLGISAEMPSFEYVPSEANISWGKKWLEERNVSFPRVGMHPGSAGGKRQERKRWCIDNFIETARRLTAQGVSVVVFEGPFERDIGDIMEKEVKRNIFVVRGEKLDKIAGLMKLLDVVITNDSGLMHLAAALKVPLVALFGPTDFRKNYPLSDNSLVIRKSCPHSPCYLMKEAPCGENIDCMKEITPIEVIQAVFELLKK